jgi:protein-tyrosine phosphatase
LNKKKVFWSAFAVLALVFATIQFVPSPPVVIPAALPAAERDAHRLFNFGGIHNFRDLGGYGTTDGRRVRWGKLYRTATLSEATDADLRALQKLELAYLVDFRSAAEKEEEPHRLPDPPGFSVVEIPILDEGNSAMVGEVIERVESGDFSGFDPQQFMLTANRQFAGQFTPQFRQFIEQVQAADGAPLAWNCSAGKDRTGFAAAILLRILGVPQEMVMADYMASNEPSLEARKTQLLMLRLFKGDEAAEKLGQMMGVEQAWLQAAFDEIDSTWGSFGRYVGEGLELTPADIASLRATLLE